MSAPRVAIIDYGMGNIFSVKHACAHVGIEAELTSDKAVVSEADAIILPGVGAFGDAMATLNRLDLVEPMIDAARSGKPFMGICLGLQLIMTESLEFGTHRGLGLIEGRVLKIEDAHGQRGEILKVPHVGWNSVLPPLSEADWSGTMLEGVAPGEYQYFVHSFYVRPEDDSVVLSRTRYGDFEFCSAIERGNLFACQFHPERSGREGLKIYLNFSSMLKRYKQGGS